MEAGWGLWGQAPIQGTRPAPSLSGEAASAGEEGRGRERARTVSHVLGIFLDDLVVLMQV